MFCRALSLYCYSYELLANEITFPYLLYNTYINTKLIYVIDELMLYFFKYPHSWLVAPLSSRSPLLRFILSVVRRPGYDSRRDIIILLICLTLPTISYYFLVA